MSKTEGDKCREMLWESLNWGIDVTHCKAVGLPAPRIRDWLLPWCAWRYIRKAMRVISILRTRAVTAELKLGLDPSVVEGVRD